MPKKPVKSYWLSMRLRSFSDIKLENGMSLREPVDPPCKFISAFETRQDAIDDSGDESLITEIRPVQ